jgi:hypothetical protein
MKGDNYRRAGAVKGARSCLLLCCGEYRVQRVSGEQQQRETGAECLGQGAHECLD